MKISYLFLAPGFEEVEALTVVDIMRRAGLDVKTVSILDQQYVVTGAHGIQVAADLLMPEVETESAEWLIIPGGMPGATNCAACSPLTTMLVDHYKKGGKIAAICAAPAVVLAPLGIFVGKEATCYPGFENALGKGGMTAKGDRVVSLSQLITANGPASAMAFALSIVSSSCGQGVAEDVAAGLLYK